MNCEACGRERWFYRDDVESDYTPEKYCLAHTRSSAQKIACKDRQLLRVITDYSRTLKRSRDGWENERRQLQAVIANQRRELRELHKLEAHRRERQDRIAEVWVGRIARLKFKCRRLGLRLAEVNLSRARIDASEWGLEGLEQITERLNRVMAALKSEGARR